MNKVVILETSYLRKLKRKELETTILKLRKSKLHLVVPDMVLREYTNFIFRTSKADKQKLINFLKDFKDVFNIRNLSEENIYRVLYDKLLKYYTELFDFNNILKLDYKSLVQEVVERDKDKLPPFKLGNSDKGFKDTFIWLGIKEYILKNDFDKYILIADDGDFVNNKNALSKELGSKGKNFTILKFLNIDELLIPAQKIDSDKNMFVDENVIVNSKDISKEKTVFDTIEEVRKKAINMLNYKEVLDNGRNLVTKFISLYKDSGYLPKQNITDTDILTMLNMIGKYYQYYPYDKKISLEKLVGNSAFSNIIVEYKFANDLSSYYSLLLESDFDLHDHFIDFFVQNVNDLVIKDDLPF